MNFENCYQKYVSAKKLRDRNESHHQIRKLIGSIASKFPRDNSEALAWFTASLIDDERKWFTAKLLEKVSPVPKSLFDDLVLAALCEPDPSFNKWFIQPCVKTFGKEQVKAKVLQFASIPQVIENDGVNKIMYWIPRVAV